jgi:hypothetical protein
MKKLYYDVSGRLEPFSPPTRPLEICENFIHVPDTEEEAKRLLEFRERELVGRTIIIYDDTNSFISKESVVRGGVERL